MENLLGNFINSIYIRGYFDNGSVNGETYTAKPFFVLNLLIGSVRKPNLISFTEPALNGYICGNSIDTVVEALINAEYSNELLENYIKELYERQHKNTPTYQDRFKGKNYKEALYEEVKDKYPGITPDNMSDILAKDFTDKIGVEKVRETVQTEITQIVYSYTISESDKKEIKNICDLIDERLVVLGQRGTNIYVSSSIVHNKVNELQWRCKQLKKLKQYIKLYNAEYDNCCQFCTPLVDLLRTKIRIKKCIKDIYDISNDIINQKYLASQKDFYFEKVCAMISNFQENHQMLLECIDEL